MLEKLLNKLQDLAKDDIKFDPAKFNDPIAMQTQWTSAKGGGANFRTHKLIEIDPNRLEFKASIGAKMFYFFFIIMGSIFPVIILINKEFIRIEMLIFVLFGLVFIGVGAYLVWYGTAPIVFDRYKGCYWKGWKKQDTIQYGSNVKNFTRLDNIHAIQLLSECCRGSKSSYYSYELNLVLKDGNRINVIDHGNAGKIREDAQTLAKFLGVQVWDAI